MVEKSIKSKGNNNTEAVSLNVLIADAIEYNFYIMYISNSTKKDSFLVDTKNVSSPDFKVKVLISASHCELFITTVINS